MSLKEKTKKHSAELKAPDVKFKDLSYQVEVRKGKWTVCINYKDIKPLWPASESHRNVFIAYIRKHVTEIILP